MLVTIHRGARQIGGNCIELESAGARVLLDIGAPLDLAEGEQATLPKTLRLGRDGGELLGVIVSHAHQDHYGLWSHVDESVPCYIGEASLRILSAAKPFLRNAYVPANARTYASRQPFQVGPFRITPFIVDHSAYDAHALLVEADGKRVLYTGDLRDHGRKPGALPRLLSNCPKPLDALVIEGTTVGRAEPGAKPMTEAGLERVLVGHIRETQGLVLAFFAGQNIDRFVTFFKAAKRTGRTMVVDVYAAEILRAAGNPNLPTPSPNGLRVYLPNGQRRGLGQGENLSIVDRYYAARIYQEELLARRGELVMLFRPGMKAELARMVLLENARLVYSMWSGYLDKHLKTLPTWCHDNGVEFEAQHVSGHADVATLRRVIDALKPTWVVPIHTSDPAAFAHEFPGALLLSDGVPLAL